MAETGRGFSPAWRPGDSNNKEGSKESDTGFTFHPRVHSGLKAVPRKSRKHIRNLATCFFHISNIIVIRKQEKEMGGYIVKQCDLSFPENG